MTAETAQLLFKDFTFDDPVLVDLVSGSVYAIHAGHISKAGNAVVFDDMPIIDSPLLVAERTLLHLERD